MMRRCVLFAMFGVVLPFAVTVAPPAVADCVDAGGATVCAQGTVRGGGPEPPTAGPYYPYPCELDWYCDTGGLNIIIGGGDGGWDGGGGRPIRPR